MNRLRYYKLTSIYAAVVATGALVLEILKEWAGWPG